MHRKSNYLIHHDTCIWLHTAFVCWSIRSLPNNCPGKNKGSKGSQDTLTVGVQINNIVKWKSLQYLSFNWRYISQVFISSKFIFNFIYWELMWQLGFFCFFFKYGSRVIPSMSLKDFSSISWIGFMRNNEQRKNTDYLQLIKRMNTGRHAFHSFLCSPSSYWRERAFGTKVHITLLEVMSLSTSLRLLYNP